MSDDTTPPTEETVEQAQERYRLAAHAVMTGVGYKIARDPAEAEPKHLRTGVNSALVSTSALANLLIGKGVITDAEWFIALADAMEAEKRSYEAWLKDSYGGTTDITLA